MNLRIDRESAVPAYLQLYEGIKEDIVNGIYPYSSRLPSKRMLAEETGVSTVTAAHAYGILLDEGYIEARQRSGFFVSFRTTDGFAASPQPSSARCREASHSTPGFPFSVLAKTIRRTVSWYGDSILERAPNQGRLELREALRQYLARNRGIHASTEQIIIGSGAEYLYSLIALLLGRDRIYALEYPSYEKIGKVYSSSGIKCDFLPLADDGIGSAALEETRATVLHISPYRSYPSGVTASASKRYEYIRWAGRKSGCIIEDDFMSEFSVSSKPEETLFSLSEGKCVIYMNTFSKTVSPALRIGYMVLPESLLESFYDKAGFYSCTVPVLEQLVMAELIASGDFERHINRVRRAERKRIAAARDIS